MSAPDPFSAFVQGAEEYWRDRPSMRRGQAYFNYLNTIDPDIANGIRGTDLDPFNVDDRIGEFLTHVESLLS